MSLLLALTGGAPGGSQALTQSARFDNAQSLFSPVVTPGAVSLTPGLLSNSQSFFAPTVTPGAVTLAPGLFSNDQSFFSPTVALTSGPQTLTQDVRFDNAQAFFSPTLTPGAAALEPPLLLNSQTFFAPTVTQGVELRVHWLEVEQGGTELRVHWLEVEPGVELRVHWLEVEPNTGVPYAPPVVSVGGGGGHSLGTVQRVRGPTRSAEETKRLEIKRDMEIIQRLLAEFYATGEFDEEIEEVV